MILLPSFPVTVILATSPALFGFVLTITVAPVKNSYSFGCNVGAAVGSAVGASVGAAVALGSAVGASVGAAVALGSAVGTVPAVAVGSAGVSPSGVTATLT